MLWFLTKHINCISVMYGEECRNGIAECHFNNECIDGKCACMSDEKNYNHTSAFSFGLTLTICISNGGRYFHINCPILTTNREEIS